MAEVEFSEIHEAAIAAGAVTSALADVGSDTLKMRTILGATLADNNTRIAVEVENSGATDLSAFALMVQAHSGAAFVNLLAGSDWVSPAISIKEFVSVVPDSLAAAAFSTFIVHVGPVHAIKFQAKTAASTTTLNIKVRIGR